jgi:hypothetical protein
MGHSSEERTSIQVSYGTKRRLMQYGSFGETYESVVLRLLQNYENCENGHSRNGACPIDLARSKDDNKETPREKE